MIGELQQGFLIFLRRVRPYCLENHKVILKIRELENYKVQNGALHTENAQLQVQIKNLQMEKDSDKLKLVMAQKEVTNLSESSF